MRKLSWKQWAVTATIAVFVIAVIYAASGEPGWLSSIGGVVATAALVLWGIVFFSWANRQSSTSAPGNRTRIPGAEESPQQPPAPQQPSSARFHFEAPVRTPTPGTRREARASHMETEPRVEAPAAGAEYFLMGSDGWAGLEVEGEFARIPAIHAAIGRTPRIDQEIELDGVPTELRPEPNNQYDKNAVMVIINGYHVGYLARDDASRYHAPLLRFTQSGVIPMARARVWTVMRRDYRNGQKGHARISLAIGEPDKLAPANNPPTLPYSLLPRSGRLQVTGEEAHLDVLSEYVSESGESDVIGTLHIIHAPAPKGTTKELVEVRIDGDRIGQMTPGSSAHYIPTIKHLDDQGLLTAAWLTVQGSVVAAQAVLHATRAHELPAEWFEAPSTIPALYPHKQPPQPMWED